MSAETNDSAQASPEKKNNTTLLVLLGILALGVAGLIYDRRVARPGVEKAYDDLVLLVEKTNRSVNESVNPEDVQAVVGRAPISSFDDGDDFIEVFAWRSGLPIRTHKLYAVYRDQHGQKVFYRHAKYKYDKKNEVIAIPDLMTVESESNAEPSGYGTDGAASDGEVNAPAAGSNAGGGRRFDPEATFAAADADGDGVLKGDEISDRMQENLSETDTDGDGEISKSEFMARMEVVSARFQARPAQDQSGYSSRPADRPAIPRGQGGIDSEAAAESEPASNEPAEEEESEES